MRFKLSKEWFDSFSRQTNSLSTRYCFRKTRPPSTSMVAMVSNNRYLRTDPGVFGENSDHATINGVEKTATIASREGQIAGSLSEGLAACTLWRFVRATKPAAINQAIAASSGTS